MNLKGLKWFVMLIVFLTVFTVCFGFTRNTYALPDSELSYQGRLTNSSGDVVSDGTYSIVFSIYTSSSTPDNVWSETQSVTTKNGIFSVILGSVNPITIDFNESKYYLGIKVGSDSEMSPRTQIGAAPFAVNSKKLDGKNAGTGANDILSLNSSGEIDIGSAIKTSTYLQAGDGLNVSGGVDFSGATMSSAINLNNHNLTNLNTITGYASNSIKFNIGGSDIFEVSSDAVKIVPSSGVDLNINNQSITNATYIEAGSGQNLDLAVDGTDGILIHNTTANVEIMSGNLLLTDHEITFDGSSSISYDSGSSQFQIASGNNVNIWSGNSDAVVLGFDNGVSTTDVLGVDSAGVEIDIPVGGSFDIDVNSLDAMAVNSSGTTFSSNVYMTTTKWLGLGATDANLLFTEAGVADYMTLQNSNLVVEDGSWMGLGSSGARLVFHDDTTDYITVGDASLIMGTGHRIGISATDANIQFTEAPTSTINISATTTGTINITPSLTFVGGTNFIGYGGGVNGRIDFDNTGTDTITINQADFVVSGNNNYYSCTNVTVGGDCTDTPTANTGRTITISNDSANVISSLNSITLVKGSDNTAGDTIAVNATVFLLYNGTNWVVIGQGH